MSRRQKGKPEKSFRAQHTDQAIKSKKENGSRQKN